MIQISEQVTSLSHVDMDKQAIRVHHLCLNILTCKMERRRASSLRKHISLSGQKGYSPHMYTKRCFICWWHSPASTRSWLQFARDFTPKLITTAQGIKHHRQHVHIAQSHLFLTNVWEKNISEDQILENFQPCGNRTYLQETIVTVSITERRAAVFCVRHICWGSNAKQRERETPEAQCGLHSSFKRILDQPSLSMAAENSQFHSLKQQD